MESKTNNRINLKKTKTMQPMTLKTWLGLLTGVVIGTFVIVLYNQAKLDKVINLNNLKKQ